MNDDEEIRASLEKLIETLDTVGVANVNLAESAQTNTKVLRELYKVLDETVRQERERLNQEVLEKMILTADGWLHKKGAVNADMFSWLRHNIHNEYRAFADAVYFKNSKDLEFFILRWS